MYILKLKNLTHKKMVRKILETILFSTKWLLIPFYFGLMFSLAIFSFIDLKEIYHLLHGISSLDEQSSIIIILKLIDLTMIANLVKMIIIGSYTSFFQKHNNHNNINIDDPNLNTSSGVLKVKIATSLIGVTSINLLQSFYITQNVSESVLNNQLIIHFSFIAGALALAFIDLLHVKAEVIHNEEKPELKH
jgi:uncharacterized protein (TIGR00645 family)